MKKLPSEEQIWKKYYLQDKSNNNKMEFKEHGCNSKLRVAYGQCECGAAITTQTQNMDSTFGSVGIPLPGIKVGIFDDENKELGYNKRGNIYAATPYAMIRYYKNEEENKKHFYIDKDEVKWSKTGDIGYLNSNGELFVSGRANDYSIINNKKELKKILKIKEIKYEE